jgi:hypothetical protein
MLTERADQIKRRSRKTSQFKQLSGRTDEFKGSIKGLTSAIDWLEGQAISSGYLEGHEQERQKNFHNFERRCFK